MDHEEAAEEAHIGDRDVCDLCGNGGELFACHAEGCERWVCRECLRDDVNPRVCGECLDRELE